jgi:lysophospholipase L1-like esterase
MLRLLSDVRNHFAERIGALTGFPLAIPNYPKMAAGKEPALILAFSPKEKEIVVPASDGFGRLKLASVQFNWRMLRGKLARLFHLPGAHTLASAVRGGGTWLLAATIIPGAAAQQDLAIYTDALQNDWANWSFSATIDLAYDSNSQYVYSGSNSIAVSPEGWGALALEHTPFDSTPYATISFWINGGPTGGQPLALMATLDWTTQGSQYNFTLAANQCQHIIVPLSMLSVADATNFDGIFIQSQSASALPVFYVDDLTLSPPGPASAATTFISAKPAAIPADGLSTALLTVQARDALSNNLVASGGTVTLNTTAGTLNPVTDHTNGTYTAIMTASTNLVTAIINGTIAGVAISNGITVRFTFNSGPFVITNIQTSPGGTRLAWNAFPGQSYSMQTSSNLTTWTSASVGMAAVFTDNNAPDQQSFYRVRVNLNPNPRISVGKPTFSNLASAGVVDDGKFLSSAWGSISPRRANPDWVALHLGSGPTRVLLEWNAGYNYNYADPISPTSTPAPDYGSPRSYNIYTSSNSTTGSNGSWTLVASVTNNTYRTRAHSFDFTGMSWVKMSVTMLPSFTANGLAIDEIEVYDISVASNRGRLPEDTWFFMGDSITAFWADRTSGTGTNDPASHQPSFAVWINIDNPNYFPAMIDGGIGGETTAGGLARLAQNLADNPDYYYWALDYGANDSSGNSADTTAFAVHLQSMITQVLAAGRMPVIPHIAYTLDGEHTNVPIFNAVIDQLVAANHILAGPDAYTYFLNHTNDFQSDGLHPNDAGMRAYNLIWSQAMRSLYP